MMNHCVPDYDIDGHNDLDRDLYHSTSSRKPNHMQEDEVMELLWQNGQVVMHRPNKLRAATNGGGGGGGGSSSTQSVAHADAPQLFIQEDEMASWLHYPLDDEPRFDRDFCSDFLFQPPASTAAGSCTDTAVKDPVQSSRDRDRDRLTPPPKPPIPPTRRADEDFRSHQGFGHFTRIRPRQDSEGASAAVKGFGNPQSVLETVVESNATPLATAATAAVKAGVVAGSSSVGGEGVVETTSLDFTVESSEAGRLSACNGDKKRKGREGDELECHSQDVAVKAADTKKQCHGSTAKRTRAAEVHNLSERRRRDRINEKMKALQELIPRCNKSDKASMLDDAIEYLKSLQMQVQMMSMGCGMVPMMFPGMQQYMQPIGMGMGVDVNQAMMPFPMATPTPTHMGPGFPVPSYHPIPPFVSPDSSRLQVNNQGSLLNPARTQNAYQQQFQIIPDQYQQYLGNQTMQQMQPPQNDAKSLPVTSKPIPSGPENMEPRPLPG